MVSINWRWLVLLPVIGLSACSQNPQRMRMAELDFAREHYRLSFNHAEMPARAGNPDAQYALGYMYYYGKGVIENRKLARYWFHLAANQGHPDAQRALKLIDSNHKNYPWPHNVLQTAQEQETGRRHMP